MQKGLRRRSKLLISRWRKVDGSTVNEGLMIESFAFRMFRMFSWSI